MHITNTFKLSGAWEVLLNNCVPKNVLWRHKKSDAEADGEADELLYRCELIGRWGLCAGFPE